MEKLQKEQERGREASFWGLVQNLKRPINIIGRIYHKSFYFQVYLVEIFLITELIFLFV